MAIVGHKTIMREGCQGSHEKMKKFHKGGMINDIRCYREVDFSGHCI